MALQEISKDEHMPTQEQTPTPIAVGEPDVSCITSVDHGTISSDTIPQDSFTDEVDPKVEALLADLIAACRMGLKRFDEERIRRAVYFCVRAHGKDLRASGEPYYTHPLAVATLLVRETPLDEASVIAALLHDVAEDTEYTLHDIGDLFGSDVAAIVDGVTKISGAFETREIRQAASYRKLLLSMVSDVRVMLVKFADRLHNMRTLQHMTPEKQKRIARETLDIYSPFAHRLGFGNIKWELEDLAFKYLNREAFDEIKKALNLKRDERNTYVEDFAKPIQERLVKEGFRFEISSRAKHMYSIYNKMVSRGKSLDDVYDLFAVRIILDTENVNDCFVAYGIISDIYTPVPERFKNYISVPKKNGYQSLHTTVIGPDGKKVEVQIRTRKMHEISELGLAAHFRYKEHVTNTYVEDRELEEWANWVRDIFDSAGDEAPEQLIESFKLNLFQEEIYVFTPKGDLRILPKDATPIDFAFDIHSRVGYHTIGAKVNGKIVPLNYVLQRGDQVEILTSKNQSPSKDWERFVVTHKAKSAIRKFLNEDRRAKVLEGREIWDRKVKRIDLHINEDELDRFAHSLRFQHKGDFLFALATGLLDVDVAGKAAIDKYLKPKEPPAPEPEPDKIESKHFEKFVNRARTEQQNSIRIVEEGGKTPVMYSYARCCNPVPGDDIVGIVTIGNGIKIHRKQCKNVKGFLENAHPRLMEVAWAGDFKEQFMAGIRLSGDDRTGLVSDITTMISSLNNTNIRSVNIDSYDNHFEGVVTVYVKDKEHLDKLFSKLKKIQGIKTVERFEE